MTIVLVQRFLNSNYFPIVHVLIALFLGLIIIRFRKHHSAQAQPSGVNFPPGPMKVPIIGNLHQMIFGAKSPHSHLRNMARKYGPIFRLQLGERLFFVISTPEVAKQVLKTQELNFAQRPHFIALDMVYSDRNSSVVFCPYGDYWRKMRKVTILELLNARKVGSFGSIRRQEVNQLVECISLSCGSPFNLSKALSGYNISFVCKAAFGIGHNFKQERITGLVRSMIEEGLSGLSLAELFPSIKMLRFISGTKWKMNQLREEFGEMFTGIIDDHRRRKADKHSFEDRDREDFVDVLLRVQESDEELEFGLSDNGIKDIILDVFTGGFDTSLVTMEWAMSELLRNPSTMAKAQAEVREVLKGKGSVEESDIEQLNYLQLVIKETLRLHPPATLYSRETRVSSKINGYDIPVNSKVLINAWALGRDPEYWKDPDSFIPERFRETSTDFKGAHYHYLPFGSGRRMCPGSSFAMASLELTLASLLYHFDWELPGAGQELDMSEAFGGTVKRQKDLYVIPRKIH